MNYSKILTAVQIILSKALEILGDGLNQNINTIKNLVNFLIHLVPILLPVAISFHWYDAKIIIRLYMTKEYRKKNGVLQN